MPLALYRVPLMEVMTRWQTYHIMDFLLFEQALGALCTMKGPSSWASFHNFVYMRVRLTETENEKCLINTTKQLKEA